MSEQINVNQLKKDPSPHLYAKPNSQWIMVQVIIALLFPTASAVYFFGWRVLLLIGTGMVTAVAAEYIFQKLARRKSTIKDLSAVVTGYLLALSLPVTAPLWTVVIGSLFAILVVKQLPGGIGRNLFNPAVAARVMLKAFFSPWITNWVLPGPDLVSTATPLEYIGNFTSEVAAEVPGLWDLFIGVGVGGPVGETSKVMILIGMLYLIGRKIIPPTIPLLYLAALALVTTIYGGFSFQYFMTHVLSGTAFFAATYMVTDYSSQPITPDGKLVFAVGAGLLTGILRIVTDFPGGVGFSILIMNALAPLTDRYLAPRIYGHRKRIEKNNPLRERVTTK
ncbi:RnfABCDGE type electron transport complex subunit D [Jeotgalibaca caeni]|uniref:RnfABCDGE type electron transport complex subunit D n=1 Tax=Jeotgalibaca caeni TaxID=3028623 RepID=UPI00237ED7D3|nr:RnfABCDGE type electron transport complex subunit D [Jeotgalibaca caeni]MDE1548082.1 RnfABCDGE type electron transport complex subunit D [Jeotgalibaca caeni]